MKPIALISLLILSICQPLHAEQRLFNIAIIDQFYPPMHPFETEEDRLQSTWLYGLVDIDNDLIKEPLFHGDVVQMIANDPSFVFFRYPLAGQTTPMKEILNALISIHDKYEKAPIDAVILSWESSTLVSSFETPLRRENRSKYVAMIEEWGNEFPSWKETYLVIRALEALTSKGVAVFTISGNSGSRSVNTLSFAEGVTTVGAAEEELSYFISDNAFVDTYEQAAYLLTRLDDAQGVPVGYDLDGDGCQDVPIQQVTGQSHIDLPKSYWPPLKGSSFAAPKALKKALLGSIPLCKF